MSMEDYKDFNDRFLRLAIEARSAGHCRSNELGEMVAQIVHKAMNHRFSDGKNFQKYSEDIKLEMFGESVLAIYNAILTTAKLDNAQSLYNYAYTVSLNTIRTRLRKFYSRENVIEFNENGRQQDPSGSVFAREKRRLMIGVFKSNEKLVMNVAKQRNIVRLHKVVRLAVDSFTARLNNRKLKQLINQARKIREEAAC